MPYDINNYLGNLLKSMSDLESSKQKNTKAEAQLQELEAKVAELEEKERHWQEERQDLLNKFGDDNG